MEVRFGPLDHPQASACQPVGEAVGHRGNHDVGRGDPRDRPAAGDKGHPLGAAVLGRSADFQAAWEALEQYEKRWLIEEFHKALKTGCRLEERQYETAKRLEAITGVLSVVAVRLLQLKMLARNEPQRPADQVVPRTMDSNAPVPEETAAERPLERSRLLPGVGQTWRLPRPQVGRRTGLDNNLAWI